MSYIDGFVAAVPTVNKDLYLEHVKTAAKCFKEHGALKLTECWGDDVPSGETTSFPMAVKCQPDETVVFGLVEWPSKAVRDSGMQKVMEDERMSAENNPMPLDGKRLIYGGFQVIFNQ
ncbi:DUF1428 domain-containing protein [Gilvimarinus agarilyticus]|uniref:DUF1428 domain-containing protein n=1 Tax=Gilvimarinus agarilyticus TaxID=679259 RepID=UPI0005A25CB9|nr:DUF1428 domain-containing protein [Gilvimarinus agarilyticus]